MSYVALSDETTSAGNDRGGSGGAPHEEFIGVDDEATAIEGWLGLGENCGSIGSFRKNKSGSVEFCSAEFV